jgi:hypothetical protein
MSKIILKCSKYDLNLKLRFIFVVLLIKLYFLQATHHMCIPLHFQYHQAFPMVTSGAQDKLQFA